MSEMVSARGLFVEFSAARLICALIDAYAAKLARTGECPHMKVSVLRAELAAELSCADAVGATGATALGEGAVVASDLDGLVTIEFAADRIGIRTSSVRELCQRHPRSRRPSHRGRPSPQRLTRCFAAQSSGMGHHRATLSHFAEPSRP
jgi:hypothetical protein